MLNFKSSIYWVRFAIVATVLTFGTTGAFGADILFFSGKHWKVFRSTGNSRPVCYMISEPTSYKGNFRKRGDPYIAFSTIDSKEFLFICTSGYPYRTKASPKVAASVSGKAKIFSTKITGKSDCLIKGSRVNGMISTFKAGKSAKVSGISHKGTTSEDRYSLAGFTEAFGHLVRACRK